ncbi:MAG: PKD domain-containing protein, partial [Reichenbachiella sp.]
MKKLLIFIITFSFYYISFAQTTVVALEYYIDEDPGLGLGTSIALSPDTEVTVDQSLDLSALALPLGTHTIYVRSQDSNGKWSFYEGRRFLISDAANPVPRAIPNIVNAEYFIDEDPGIGLGTAISFTSATAIETGISIDIPGLSLAIGRHTIYVRAQDANGSWSLFEGRAFLINEGANVATPVVADAVELEYFIDEDPGIGNAQNITISTGAAPSVDFVVPLDIEAGWHSIFVRSKNVDEKWGVYEQRRFLVQEPIISSTSNTDIVMIEYFFNADPGLGNGAQIEVGPNQDLDLSDLELASLGTLPVGMNYVTIRAQNADGNWGFYETREFEVIDDCTQPVAGFDMVLACNGSQSTFTNTSTNLQDDATYKWYLNGDAVEDMTTADAAHIYDFPGTYSVGLAVRQGQICLDSIGYEFVIKESPTVFFSADPSITGQPSQIIVEQFNVTE